MPGPPSPNRSVQRDLPHLAFTLAFAAVAVWSWAGIALAEIGAYRPHWLVPIAGAATVAAWVLVWRSERRARSRTRARVALCFVTIVAAGIAAFLRPGEYLIDGADESVYLNIGRALVQHGALSFSEPLLDVVGRADWPALFSFETRLTFVYDFFPGGIQLAADRNRILPGFFHLLPVWLAHFQLAGGPALTYYGSSLFAVLSVVAVWLLARALSSLFAANVAAVLLILNFAQLWFAWTTASEMLTQFFVMSGLYFTAVAAQRPSAVLGAGAGSAFGLAAFTRIDALVLISPLVALAIVAAIARRQWSRSWTAIAIAFVAITSHAIAHAAWFSRSYTWRLWTYTTREVDVTMVSIAILVAVAGTTAWVMWTRAQSKRLPAWIPWAAAAAVLALAVMRFGTSLIDGYLPMLLSPFGLVLAGAGIVWMARGEASIPVWLTVGILAASTLVYGASVWDRQMMPGLFRRFVPVIVPLALVFVGHVSGRLFARAGWWRVLAVGAPAALAAIFLGNARIALAAPVMQNVERQVSAFAATIPANAVVLMDASTPSHLGLALHYAFRRDVIFVTPRAQTRDALTRLADTLARDGRDLMAVLGTTGNRPRALSADDLSALDLAPAGSSVLTFTQIEPSIDRFPDRVRTVRHQLEVYRVRRAAAMPLPIEIGIGDHDAEWRISGLFDAETMGPDRGRWTGPSAAFLLPRVDGSQPVTLALRIAAPRPAGAAPPVASLRLDDQHLGETPPLSGGFMEIRIPMPPWASAKLAAGRTRLTLQATPFVPAEHGGGDTRALGVALDWMRLETR